MLISDINVLVVDDVNAVRAQVKQMLKECGFKSITLAANGAEARAALEAERYHLVLSDWYMEPVDGLELLRFIRSHPQLLKLPFIMVTAEGTREKVIQAIQLGIDDYMVKPLTPANIQTKVIGLLLKRGLI